MNAPIVDEVRDQVRSRNTTSVEENCLTLRLTPDPVNGKTGRPA